MATQPIHNNRQNDIVIYKEFLFNCLQNWYWFAGLLVVMLALAGIYLLRTPKTYSAHASVLVLEEEKSQNGLSKISREFSSLGVMQATMNINNEMARFSSHDVLIETARRMDLGTQYWEKLHWRTNMLYGKSVPVRVVFEDADDLYRAKMMMNIHKDGSLRLHQFMLADTDIDGEIKIDRPDSLRIVNTPIGRVRLYPTESYAEKAGNIYVTHTTPYAAGMNIGNNLQVTYPNKKNSIIEIAYSDQSAERAVQVLKMLIAVYGEQWKIEQEAVARATSQFILERIDLLQNELGSIDNQISDYKSTNNITDISGVEQMYLNQYAQSEQMLTKLVQDREMAMYIRTKLLRDSTAHDLLPVSIGFGSNVLEKHINEYNNCVIEINEHLSYTSEDNPLIGNLSDRLEHMRQAILNGLDNQIETLTISIEAQKDNSAAILNKIQNSPDQAKYLLSIERQLKVKESLFLYLLQKQEEIDLSQSYASSKIRIMNAPTLNPKTNPNAKKILIMALLAAILLPMTVLVIIQIFDTTVHTPRDIYGQVSIPFLGHIPYCEKKHEIVVSHGEQDSINEAFRSLRTRLEFEHNKNAHGRGRVYALTSINPGSGKSFVALNLSVALAIRGKKVIVLDGDLRRSSYSQTVGNRQQGLSDYLAGYVTDLESILHHSETYPTLDHITVGSYPPSPTELLSGPVLGQLLEQLRDMYDYVLIDCPPINIVADTSIIEQQVDSTLYVIRAGLFEKSQLPLLEDEYQSGAHPHMSLIMNGVKQPKYFGYGNHGYHYDYSYSYSYKRKK